MADTKTIHPLGGEYPSAQPGVLAVIDGNGDPTLDPRFLGESPVAEPDGTCSFCGDSFTEHWDQDSETYLDGREWHRRDHDNNGFYADEIKAVTR